MDINIDWASLFYEHDYKLQETLFKFRNTEACDEFIISIGQGYYGAYVDRFNYDTGILWISDSGFSNMYIQQLDRWRLEPGDERIFYKVKEVYI